MVKRLGISRIGSQLACFEQKYWNLLFCKRSWSVRKKEFFPVCSADVGNRKSRPSFGNVVSGEESVEGLRSGAVEAELGSPELGHRLGVQDHQAGVVDVWLTPAREKAEAWVRILVTPLGYFLNSPDSDNYKIL